MRGFLSKIFVDETNNTLIQFFRYIFVGGIAFLVDFGLLWVLADKCHIPHVVAATISFIAGLAVNYVLSTFWIFKKSKISNKFAEFIVFALIGVVGLLLTDGIIALFQYYLAPNLIFGGRRELVEGGTVMKYYMFLKIDYYLVGKVLATAVSFIWNFFARKFIVFDKSSDK